MKVGLTALVAVVIGLAVGGAQAGGPVSGQGTWETTLQYRDLDGNVANGPEAFYDTVLDISWLRDANVNMGNNINGNFLYWQDAVAWANNLVVNGIDGWRLPTMLDTGAPGCDFSYGGGTDCGYNPQTASSELAHLFYVSLGNTARCPAGDETCSGEPGGYGLGNTGSFQNMQAGYYATGVQYALNPNQSWILDTRDGLQINRDNNSLRYATAVHDGAIGTAMPFTFPVPVLVPVPEPESYAMMLLGLGIVGSLVRRRRAASA
jgi:hypothetical protein